MCKYLFSNFRKELKIIQASSCTSCLIPSSLGISPPHLPKFLPPALPLQLLFQWLFLMFLGSSTFEQGLMTGAIKPTEHRRQQQGYQARTDYWAATVAILGPVWTNGR